MHYALNANGNILSRVQNSGGTSDPRDYHQYVNGRQVGEYTNNAGADPVNLNYKQAIGNQLSIAGTGNFSLGATTGTAGGEFGTSGYDPENPITAGTGVTASSSYTVQSGDTLQGIASQIWGDSSLWYKIADANGLSADAPLTAGQSLSIPLKGPSNTNNAGMYRPYDATRAIGDLNPTHAKPPKKGKCGAGVAAPA